tara:strand:+ start:310 stop:648 length:339 start_codon:yes stop_codon:yes gene_type:complete
MAKYRVLQGIDYPPNKRAEIGDVVDNIPATSIAWLLEDGIIEDASKPAKKEETIKVKAPDIEEPVEEIKPSYKPTAKDGDKDGLIQDGTVWERPEGKELTPEEIALTKEGDK